MNSGPAVLPSSGLPSELSDPALCTVLEEEAAFGVVSGTSALLRKELLGVVRKKNKNKNAEVTGIKQVPERSMVSAPGFVLKGQSEC